MNIMNLHASTEVLDDRTPKEQKLNSLTFSFTRELFNFTVCQNDQATTTIVRSDFMCVKSVSEEEDEGSGSGEAAVFGILRSLCSVAVFILGQLLCVF